MLGVMQLFLIDVPFVSLVASELEKACTCTLSLCASSKRWVRVLAR